MANYRPVAIVIQDGVEVFVYADIRSVLTVVGGAIGYVSLNYVTDEMMQAVFSAIQAVFGPNRVALLRGSWPSSRESAKRRA